MEIRTFPQHKTPVLLLKEVCQAYGSLVASLLKDDKCAVVRYCYSAASKPRIGVLFPRLADNGCPVNQLELKSVLIKIIISQMLLFIQMPYAEDVRSFLFADLNKIELDGERAIKIHLLFAFV